MLPWSVPLTALGAGDGDEGAGPASQEPAASGLWSLESENGNGKAARQVL